jgi:uncharacterized membrane protein
MNRLQMFFFSALVILAVGSTRPFIASSQATGTTQQMAVVRAVMFWMDGCPHCHYVIDEVIPPLQEKYGNQMQIHLIELATAEDLDRLYQTASSLGFSKDEVGVPFLIIGDRVLIGSSQIPAELPGLIEQHLATGGLDFPDLPGFAGIVPTEMADKDLEKCASDTPCTEETPGGAAALVSQPQTPGNGSLQKSNGFTLAIFVMLGMIASLLFAVVAFVRGAPSLPRFFSQRWMELALPLLCLIGLGVAGYLAYVETQAVSAVCGPVGDCNAVQSSPYARLFGFLPVGVLGVAGYLAILIGWLYNRVRDDRIARTMPMVIFGTAILGVVFSLYLTYLEPFVIKAVCIWCIISAVIMTLLLLLSLKPALQTIDRLQETDNSHAEIEIEKTSF